MRSYLANDGEYLATGDAQAHILPRHYKPDQVIVSFFRGGVLIRAVHLDEVLRDPKSMGPPSESGYSWSAWSGFVALHRFAVDTVEGRHLVYDVTNGALVEGTPSREGKAGVP